MIIIQCLFYIQKRYINQNRTQSYHMIVNNNNNPADNPPHNHSNAKPKLEIQINQLKVILNDFIEVKQKCSSLTNQLGVDFNKKIEYDDLVEKVGKVLAINNDQKDVQTVTEIKNQLIKVLTELLDFEHQLVYKKQKQKSQLKYFDQITLLTSKIPQFPPEIQKFNLQVPTYHIREQENLHKIDRITNFIQNLRKNMRRLSNAIFKNYQTKDFLMNEPEYVEAKEKYERYKMRNEQISYQIEKKVEEEIQKFLSQCQKVEQNDEYYVVKVYEEDIEKLGRRYQFAQIGHEYDTKTRRQTNVTKVNNDKIVKHAGPQLSGNKTFKNNNNLIQQSSSQPCIQPQLRDHHIFTQISKQNVTENVDNTKKPTFLQNILELRLKRKKVFDDSVWAELDRI